MALIESTETIFLEDESPTLKKVVNIRLICVTIEEKKFIEEARYISHSWIFTVAADFRNSFMQRKHDLNHIQRMHSCNN